MNPETIDIWYYIYAAGLVTLGLIYLGFFVLAFIIRQQERHARRKPRKY